MKTFYSNNPLKWCFLLTIVTLGHANEFRNRHADTPTHRVANVRKTKENGIVVKMQDGSSWKIRSSDQSAVEKFWKKKEDIVVYQNTSYFSSSPFWLLHPESKKYVYASCVKSKARKSFRYTVYKTNPEDQTLTIMRSKTSAITFKLKDPFSETFSEEWKVGTGVTVGSTRNVSSGKRKAHCFLLNIESGAICEADVLDI